MLFHYITLSRSLTPDLGVLGHCSGHGFFFFLCDGQQGIDMATSGQPELILLDMSLPVVDGWDAAKTLKGNEATKAIPIIALTAHAMAGDKEKALEAGCDDYDTKPVDLARLLEKIGQWIDA